MPGQGARRIYSLESCQDAANYKKVDPPKEVVELKETVKEEVWPEKDIVWINRPKKTVGRKRASQVFKGSNPKGRVVEEYKEITTPLAAFDHFFDEPMLTIILGIS